MADELLVSATLRFDKGARHFDSAGLGFTGIARDVSGSDFAWKSQTATTSAAALSIGAITTPGYLLIKNIEATNTSNFAAIGASTVTSSTGLAKLAHGDIAMFRLGIAAPYIVADGNTVEVIYAVIEA